MAKLALFALTLTAILASSMIASAYKTTIVTITTTTDDNGLPFPGTPLNGLEDNGVVALDGLEDNGVLVAPLDGLKDNGLVAPRDGLEDNGLVAPRDGLDENGVVAPLDGLEDNGVLDNHKGSKEHCRSQMPMQQLNHCQMHLTQGIISMVNPQQQQHLQQCCSQLKRVSEQCQCNAIQQVYDQARQQGGVMKMRQMLSKAQSLPTDCGLEVQDCPIRSPRV